MDETTTTEMLHDTEKQSQESQLKAILLLFQSKVNELKEEADRSCTLLDVGAKTKMSSEFEQALANPLDSIAEAVNNMDTQVKSIVNSIVISFLKTASDSLNSVYKSGASSDDLTYLLVLKNDTFINREKMFSFLNLYDDLPIANKYPVSFQFIPSELVNKINEPQKLAI